METVVVVVVVAAAAVVVVIVVVVVLVVKLQTFETSTANKNILSYNKSWRSFIMPNLPQVHSLET